VVDDQDRALLQRFKAGDHAAFRELVTRYQRPIFNAAYRVLGNADDATDIAQIVFLRITERLDEYDPQYRFFSWIYRIAVNESLNLLRRNGREEPLDDAFERPAPEGADPARQLSDAQQSAWIQRALMSLNADSRVVVTLRHFSGCSYREIGHILELDEKTVKSRLFEARQRLRVLLKNLPLN